jgi:hypothetical protein
MKITPSHLDNRSTFHRSNVDLPEKIQILVEVSSLVASHRNRSYQYYFIFVEQHESSDEVFVYPQFNEYRIDSVASDICG